MKLLIAATVTALAGPVLAAVGLGAPSAAGAMVSAARGGAASASGQPSITIRAIDREGKPVQATAALQSPTGEQFDLTTSHPTRVPKGAYEIAAWVNEPFGASTLFDQEISVTKSKTVIMDARAGVPLRFQVNDPLVSEQVLNTVSYYFAARTAPPDFFQNNPVRTAYAVPGKMAPGYALIMTASLDSYATPAPVDYVIVKKFTGSIPENPTFTYSKAQFARDHMTEREIYPANSVYNQGDLFLAPKLPGNPPGLAAHQEGVPPFSVDFYLLPGYKWEADPTRPFAVHSGHSYSQTLNNAVFGPGRGIGPAITGDKLNTYSFFQGEGLFSDPVNYGRAGPEPASYQIWLYQGRTLVAHRKNRTLVTTIQPKRRWYTLRIQATRGSNAGLSSSETAAYSFQARAGDSGLAQDNFWPRIIPEALDSRNAARPGTSTTVRIWFTASAGNIAAHDVRVWASANGKTWTALPATRIGGRWEAVVPNRATTGYMALRVKGTSAAGFTSSVTIMNAYAVS